MDRQVRKSIKKIQGEGSTTTYPIRNDAGGGALRGLDVEDARPHECPPRLFVFILKGGEEGEVEEMLGDRSIK